MVSEKSGVMIVATVGVLAVISMLFMFKGGSSDGDSLNQVTGLQVLSSSNYPPINGNVAPNSGSVPINTIVTFTSTHSDSNGASDISKALMLINGGTQANGAYTAAYGYYAATTSGSYVAGHIYWINDAGSAYVDAGHISSLRETCNSYSCVLPGTSVSSSGNTLTVTWKVRLKQARLNQGIYLYTTDKAGTYTGWQYKGKINITNTTNTTSVGTTGTTGSSTTTSSTLKSGSNPYCWEYLETGINFTHKGYVTVNTSRGNASGIDSCSGSYLVEYYCPEVYVDGLSYVTQYCNQGCEPTKVTCKFCEDSDAKDASGQFKILADTYFVKGSVKTESSPVGADDYCSGNKLTEYYCTSTGWASSVVDCPTISENSVCSSGKCANVVWTCDDNDKATNQGRDYFTAATLTEYYSVDGGNSGQGQVRDACIDSNQLREYYCIDPAGNGRATSEIYTCKNGCDISKGQCYPESTVSTCSDSDGGLNFTVASFCVDSRGTFNDSCQVSSSDGSLKLEEMYCLGGYCTGYMTNCTNGCSFGACNSQPVHSCIDSDGGLNYSVFGNLIYDGMEVFRDVCSGSYVIEGACNYTNNATYNGSYYCPYGCSDGKCKPYENNTINKVDLKINGADNPAPVFFKSKITASWTSTPNAVKCNGFGNWVPLFDGSGLWGYNLLGSGSKDLMAAFAYNGSVNDLQYMSNLDVSIQCWFADGTSATDTVIVKVNLPTCSDSDGGFNYYSYGKVVFNGNVVFADVCSGNFVVEQGCSKANLTYNQTYYCPYGCSNGACQPFVPRVTCTDSDGGRNYAVNGTTVFSNVSAPNLSSGSFGRDRCDASTGKLIEYYCEGLVFKSENVTCPLGTVCSNGACVQSGPICKDSDNLSYYTTGSVYIQGLKVYSDTCSGSKLIEGICVGDKLGHSNYTCPAGCSGGRCVVPSCTVGQKCKDSYTRGYQLSNCAWTNIVSCAFGCANGQCCTKAGCDYLALRE